MLVSSSVLKMYHIFPCELLGLPEYLYWSTSVYLYERIFFSLDLGNYGQSSNIKIHNLQSSNLKSIIYSTVRYPDFTNVFHFCSNNIPSLTLYFLLNWKILFLPYHPLTIQQKCNISFFVNLFVGFHC